MRAVLIIEASTPTAVNALILSLQYRRRPELSAAIVLLTTLGGVGVTTLLLWLLA
jgi:predicted permease